MRIKIDSMAGMSIDSVFAEFAKLRQDVEFYCDFNGEEISSNDTIDEAYVKITGMTKQEFDNKHQAEHDEYKRRQQEHESKIPELTREWIEKGHALLSEEYWQKWDECVPIRLNDLYQGMELGCTLDIISILNKSDDVDEVFPEAKAKIESQGHSGMSWGLVVSMVRAFHKNGCAFVSLLNV